MSGRISFTLFSFFSAGHYAYVDMAVLGSGKSAACLASEPLVPTTGACLRFHYHMDFLDHSCEWGRGAPLDCAAGVAP